MGNTVKLHRVLKASPALVFKAFTNAEAMEKWLPPAGFTARMHHCEPTVGGSFRMHFTNFATGEIMGFGGKYLEVDPAKKLRYTDVFDDPNLPGEIIVTVLFKEVMSGTEIHITQENVPAVIPLEMCYLGWQDSLTQLAMLVETGGPVA